MAKPKSGGKGSKAKDSKPKVTRATTKSTKVEKKMSLVPPATDIPEAETAENFGVIRRKDLVERICARGHLKPRDARAAIDAVLYELAEVLKTDAVVNVQPFTKIEKVKEDKKDGFDLLRLKVKLNRDL